MTQLRVIRTGLIVNPMAGLGGAVGLKGSDGDRALQALSLGARPVAPARAARALAGVFKIRDSIELVTCAGAMGAAVAETAGFQPRIVYQPKTSPTTAADTRAAAEAMLLAGIELLLFAGGDGTARDLLSVIGRNIPLLGIPCGVKMHSAVFATSPRAAGDVISVFVGTANRTDLLQDAEIMDRDDSSDDSGSMVLFGYASTPRLPQLIAPAKASGGSSESVEAACQRVARLARDDTITLIGPGTTTARIKRILGFEGTLLGVDGVRDGRVLALDLNEERILQLIDGAAVRLIVSIVGGQGFLFGRGNQQLSPSVLRKIGRDHLVIVSSLEKLTALAGASLLVDTGDERLDADFAGYVPVIVGARRIVQYPIGSPSAPATATRHSGAG